VHVVAALSQPWVFNHVLEPCVVYLELLHQSLRLLDYPQFLKILLFLSRVSGSLQLFVNWVGQGTSGLGSVLFFRFLESNAVSNGINISFDVVGRNPGFKL